MKVLILGMMGSGTLEAKIHPLSKLDKIKEIIFVRKSEGPSIDKVNYITLPRLCKYSLFHLLISPFVTTWVIISKKPELIIGYHIIPYGFIVAICAKLSKTPYILAQTGLQIQEKAKSNKILRLLTKYIFSNSINVFCPGNSSVRYWSEVFPEIKAKFYVLHSTIDINYFKPLKTRVDYDFIFLGRLHEIKNVDLIIKSLKILFTEYSVYCRIQIVGDGPEFDKLKNLAKELDLTEYVHFKGFVQDTAKYLNNSNFIVMASNSEGLPTALMQGMACGVIPITNLVGNISDIVTNNVTGYTFCNLNEHEIAEIMYRAINQDKNTLEQIRSNCINEIHENHSHLPAMKKWQYCLGKLQ